MALSKKTEKPSALDLHKLLRLDSETGILYWKRREGNTHGINIFNAKFADKVAGCVATDKKGRSYIKVRVNDCLYQAHQIIFCMIYGQWPEDDKEVDHRDGDGLNNKPSNLREASRTQNNFNRKISVNNVLGYKNITYEERTKSYRVELSANKKRIYRKRFKDLSEAISARDFVASQYHEDFYRLAK